MPGSGGKSNQVPNPPIGSATLKVWANTRTCPVEPVFGRQVMWRFFSTKNQDGIPSEFLDIHFENNVIFEIDLQGDGLWFLQVAGGCGCRSRRGQVLEG
jgi:hypothetical protein